MDRIEKTLQNIILKFRRDNKVDIYYTFIPSIYSYSIVMSKTTPYGEKEIRRVLSKNELKYVYSIKFYILYHLQIMLGELNSIGDPRSY